jgi:hypothetical protein
MYEFFLTHNKNLFFEFYYIGFTIIIMYVFGIKNKGMFIRVLHLNLF